MRIGQLAAATQVSTKTIRYYESLGLLQKPRHTPAGYRHYTPDDLERLQFIRDAQTTGLTLTGIRSVLEISDSRGTCHQTQTLLDDHLVDLDARIQRLHSARHQLLALARRAADLDPSDCTDPNRCQITRTHTSEHRLRPDQQINTGQDGR